MLKKDKPWRSKKYRDWIKSLPCCVTGRTDGIDAHHITGTKLGGMGTKPSDSYCIPLTREMHTLLHHNKIDWEEKYGKQSDHLERIVSLARKEKMLDGFTAFITGIEDE